MLREVLQLKTVTLGKTAAIRGFSGDRFGFALLLQNATDCRYLPHRSEDPWTLCDLSLLDSARRGFLNADMGFTLSGSQLK